METVEQLWGQINGYVNIPYLFTFMLLAYAVKQFITPSFKKKIKTVYVVLIIATVIGSLYVLLLKSPWDEILFTYTLGTSLHELFFKLIEQKIKPTKPTTTDDKNI